jgi:inner membrane protein
MASLFTHPVAALGLSPWIRTLNHPGKIITAGIILTLLPDADVISFALGIPYEHMLGHRGISHSFFAAVIVSGLVTGFIKQPTRLKAFFVWLYLFLSMASHSLMDAITNGGLGIAFFAPFDNERYFLPFRPVNVSTLNPPEFFSQHGLMVLKSEFLYIWLPFAVVAVLSYFISRKR